MDDIIINYFYTDSRLNKIIRRIKTIPNYYKEIELDYSLNSFIVTDKSINNKDGAYSLD